MIAYQRRVSDEWAKAYSADFPNGPVVRDLATDLRYARAECKALRAELKAAKKLIAIFRAAGADDT